MHCHKEERNKRRQKTEGREKQEKTEETEKQEKTEETEKQEKTEETEKQEKTEESEERAETMTWGREFVKKALCRVRGQSCVVCVFVRFEKTYSTQCYNGHNMALKYLMFCCESKWIIQSHQLLLGEQWWKATQMLNG